MWDWAFQPTFNFVKFQNVAGFCPCAGLNPANKRHHAFRFWTQLDIVESHFWGAFALWFDTQQLIY